MPVWGTDLSGGASPYLEIVWLIRLGSLLGWKKRFQVGFVPPAPWRISLISSAPHSLISHNQPHHLIMSAQLTAVSRLSRNTAGPTRHKLSGVGTARSQRHVHVHDSCFRLRSTRRSSSSLRSPLGYSRTRTFAAASSAGSVVTQVDEPTWSAEIDAHDGPVLVYFWATWCGPCRLMAKIAEWAAGEFPSLKVVKVETDPNPTLTEKYDVYGLPTLYVFDKGEPVKEKWEGIITKDKLTEWLKERDALP